MLTKSATGLWFKNILPRMGWIDRDTQRTGSSNGFGRVRTLAGRGLPRAVLIWFTQGSQDAASGEKGGVTNDRSDARHCKIDAAIFLLRL